MALSPSITWAAMRRPRSFIDTDIEDTRLLEPELSEPSSQDRDPQQGARRSCSLAADGAHERRAGPEPAGREQCDDPTAVRSPGEALQLDEVPQRLECFDVSHTSGEATVASCVVFNTAGPLKSDYRRFNLSPEAAGDDYGAMAEALRRRYERVKKGEVPMPDVLFVDGGKGQLAEAMKVLDELELDWLNVVAVAKGRARRPGAERLFLPGAKRPNHCRRIRPPCY